MQYSIAVKKLILDTDIKISFYKFRSFWGNLFYCCDPNLTVISLLVSSEGYLLYFSYTTG